MVWSTNNRIYSTRREREESRSVSNIVDTRSAGAKMAKSLNVANEAKSEVATLALQTAFAGLLFFGQELGKGLITMINEGWPHE